MADRPVRDIAGYRILAEIGQGAASVIYAVEDPRDGGRYALKHILKRSPKDQKFLDQAINEHEVSQAINHPLLRRSLQIIRLRSMLRITEMCLLMELVDGKTLEQARPRSMRELVRVFKVVAKALGAMHDAGFVHADLKPINIICTVGGGVKLIDFGQSCRILTVKERIQGTPNYIAPEQVSLDPITPYTDVFNLGATMYWAFTDQYVPSHLKRKVRVRVGQRFDENLRGKDGKILDPRELNPDVPGALASLILDCLQEDPRNRPKTMDQIRARLGMAIYQIDSRASAPPPPAGDDSADEPIDAQEDDDPPKKNEDSGVYCGKS